MLQGRVAENCGFSQGEVAESARGPRHLVTRPGPLPLKVRWPLKIQGPERRLHFLDRAIVALRVEAGRDAARGGERGRAGPGRHGAAWGESETCLAYIGVIATKHPQSTHNDVRQADGSIPP